MLGPKHPGTRDKNIIIIVFLCNSLFFKVFLNDFFEHFLNETALA